MHPELSARPAGTSRDDRRGPARLAAGALLFGSLALVPSLVGAGCTAITREPESRQAQPPEPAPDDETPTPPPAPAPAPVPVRPPAPPPSGANPAAAGERAAARHVLVMYRGSQRAPGTITRTREEARARAEQVLARARRGDDFAALAREMSDEPRAATSGGDLGRFGRGAMVPAFEAAVFGMRAGQISEIVETPFGFHVIQRYE